MDNAKNKNKRILVSGKNCWKVQEADQVSFLIDADAYFHAFRESAKLARKSIYIFGWDIDSRMILLRQDPLDGYPLQLGEFLNALAEKNEELNIYILIWDFVRVMDLDREWFSSIKLVWKAPENIHFHLDQKHPVGASIHHKLIVIDDALSFSGGLDLTKQRWDTPRHHPDDSKRHTFDDDRYRPHHDVQIMFSGEPAQLLGRYVRDRWQVVTGQDLSNKIDQLQIRWPKSIPVDIEHCRVGIARTQAEYEDQPGIYEAEKLYLDSIRQAQKYIYIENQYLTASKIIDALTHSLQQDYGPEIIIVLPLSTDGWLSQNTMDMLRIQAIQKLCAADKFERLGLFYAHQDGLEGDQTIKIHSKTMIIDDCFARVGSSNLNNRSMGFDTECDIAVEIEQASDQTKAIQGFLYSLLAEHLGVMDRDIQKTVQQQGSLIKTIHQLRGKNRSLEELALKQDDKVETLAEVQGIFDPERPVEPGSLIKLLVPIKDIPKNILRYVQAAFILMVLIALAAAWRYGPLQEFVAPERLKEMAAAISSTHLAWFYVLAAYALGSVLIVPITLLITLTILIFGTIKGFFFALLGSVISGTVTYWLGRVLGRDTVRSLAGDKINKISQKLGESGIMSTFLIRQMPIAPFSVVNIVAGASHIRFRDFMLGTFLGMIPGSLAIAGIVDRGFALLTNPDLTTIISTLAVLGIISGAAFFIRRKVQR